MLNIVKGIFGTDLLSHLPGVRGAGAFAKKELEGGMMPDLATEMFIGKGGLSNLEKAGVNIGDAMDNMDNVMKDWLRLDPKEFDTKWAHTGYTVDPVANKPMFEISDKEVKLQDGIDLKSLPNDSLLTLDEVFSMPTLKKAYPGIENIKISFEDDPTLARLAAYDTKNNAIIFNRQHKDWDKYNPVNTVLHEAQHYVQGKEMFTKGAGFINMKDADEKYLDAFSELVPYTNPKSSMFSMTTKKDIDRLVDKYSNLGLSDKDVKTAIQNLGNEDGLTPLESFTRTLGKDKGKKLEMYASQFSKLAEVLNIKNTASSEYNRILGDYMRVAGETFARQTEQRAGMDTAQRRAQPVLRAIDNDAINKKYGVTVDNLAPSPTEAAPVEFTNPMASSIQSSIPQGL